MAQVPSRSFFANISAQGGALKHFGWPLSIAWLASCGASAPPPAALNAEEAIIEISAAAPAGAAPLGALEASDGQGCGVFGQDGTRARVDAALRKAAAKRGANYVQVTKEEAPHMTRACFDHLFRVQALAFRVEGKPRPKRRCEPLCSPGYACEDGVCSALCNPACSPDQTCRTDRTCGPR
jgi:hypothetical protein